MGEVIKSCCYCCCTCYQSGLCCASLCCVVLPIIGLLSILAGIVFAITLAFSVGHQHDNTTSSEYTISRLVTVALTNLTLPDSNSTTIEAGLRRGDD